ncbi:TadE/TadG family type IV pilus assembly protein [Ruegeria atlantica]|uniref:Flp pilus assembly protein TadG n=1 Tax=Ruegeria atlantica TaxID=81569 RepID=A0A0P1E7N7_9RHOB|nr:TadE/TadG family type IV pilus assembly protein [Ruegeria atlantica]CUH43957.1 Flp pilus assembly protein TadG [Ruegeria atlantica]
MPMDFERSVSTCVSPSVPAQKGARHFARDESGALTIFALFMFLCIVATVGIGIDFMRFEKERTDLQYTLDRAVLAAADLDQKAEPKSVVRSYLERAGLMQHLTSINVVNSAGYREVSATAMSEIPTQFMHLSGVETLNAPAASTAEESVGLAEISIVLDVSTSIDLPALQKATKSIITQIGTKNGAWSNEISFSLIPYSSQVNAGAELLKHYNLDRFHDHSHCVNFIDNEFSKPDLSLTRVLEQTAHFDTYTETKEPIQHPVCPIRDGSAILPFQNNETVLHNYVDGLTKLANPAADEDSGLDNGANWGLILLDPGTQPVIAKLATTVANGGDGIVPESFDDRPLAYNGNVLKVLIVVSDGENTDQHMLNPSMRTTMSDIWYNEDADRFSVYHSNGSPMYWWPHNNSWQDHAYGQGNSRCTTKGSKTECVNEEEPGNAVQLSHVDLLNLVSLEHIENKIFTQSPSAYGQWEASAFSKKNAVAKDQRTKHVCKAAKDEGVIVFSVSVDAPTNGQKVLQGCASSASHYYDASAPDLTNAFTSIASSVRMLRLTQ